MLPKVWNAAIVAAVAIASTLPVGATEAVVGPASIQMKEADATIKLPAGFAFVSKEDAKKAIEEEGGSASGLQGIIIPTSKGDKEGYFVVCRFEDIGYVSDDDANKINADDILNSYKDGAKDQNEERKEKNLPPIYVTGWAEKPHYEKPKHQVVWAIAGGLKDDPKEPPTTVNYNTRILGRRGVLSLNLVTDPDKVTQNKIEVGKLLNQTAFNKGADYKDYVAGKDKSAGFGLAGLILGGGAVAAAAKLGMFGALWKWGIGIVLVLKKFLIIGVAAIAAAISKFKNRGKAQAGQAGNSNVAAAAPDASPRGYDPTNPDQPNTPS